MIQMPSGRTDSKDLLLNLCLEELKRYMLRYIFTSDDVKIIQEEQKTDLEKILLVDY